MVLLRKRLSYGFLIVLCLLLLILSLAPPVVRWQAEEWLEARGLDAEFQHFSVSLGRGRIELGGLSGRGPLGNGFTLQRLVLDIALLPLLNQQVVIESVELSGFSLDVHQLPNDTVVGGLSLSGLAGGPVQQTPVVEPDIEPEPALDWSLVLESLSVTDVELCLASESASLQPLARHCLSVAGIEIIGGVLVPSLQRSTLQLPQELTVVGLSVDDTENQLNVLSIETLGVQGVHYSSEQLKLQRLSLKGLALLERQVATAGKSGFHAALGDLQLHRVLWQPQALEMESLTLAGLKLLLHRDQTGQPALNSWVERLTLPLDHATATESEAVAAASEAEEPAVASTSVAEAAVEPSTIYLKSFSIGGESSITMLDESVHPQLQQSLSDLHVELNNIDGRDVRQASELKLMGRLGEFGALTLSGDVWPFRDTLNMNLAVGVEALDLLPFSAYLEQTIGYQVRTGQLNQQLTLDIKEDVLDARAELEFDKFHLQTLSAANNDGSLAAPKEAASGEVQSAETSLLPIGVALNLLRDSDDKIQLVLPVSGHVDEPNLSVSHVLGVVMRKAMTAAVMNYYAPFGLIDLATALAKSATALKFEPFVFAAGAAEIEPSQTPRLLKFSQLLGDKPQLSLSLCGSASGNDALNLLQLSQVPETGLVLTPAQHQQLQDLMGLRLKGIKSTLLQEGVSARQVVLCQPALELDRFADAEVEVSL